MIDTCTEQIVGDVPGGPISDFVLSSNGRALFVALLGIVKMVDVSTLTTIGTINAMTLSITLWPCPPMRPDCS